MTELPQTKVSRDVPQDHGGNPLPADADLFADPPAEIGEVHSAQSTLRRGMQPWTTGQRLGVGLFLASLGGVVGLLLTAVLNLSLLWQVFWTVVLAVPGPVLLLRLTRFRHVCTYVGKEGVARFTCADSREDVTEEVFRFQDAVELRTGQTRQYLNGVYQGTAYHFTWTDADGRTRFRIAGTHSSEKNLPPSGDPFHFGNAAEQVWSMYLLAAVPEQLDEDGVIYFSLGGDDWVRVGPGFMDLYVGGQTVHCEKEELARAVVEQGVFTIKRTDAREGWFSSRGVFRFRYDSLANARLFLLLVENVVGVPVG